MIAVTWAENFELGKLLEAVFEAKLTPAIVDDYLKGKIMTKLEY
jgi:hypothetical protein